MSWLATLVLCVLVVEIVVRLPFAILLQKTRRTAAKALWTLRARRVSDHWKEKVMVAYAARMFACSFTLAGLLIVVMVPVVAIVLMVDLVMPGFSQFIVDWRGILASLVIASLYLSIRRHLPHARLQPARQAVASAGATARPGSRTQL